MFLNIHWICEAPSPYNDYLFRSLAADPDINLTVHFKEKNLSSHPWSKPMAQGFPSRYCKKILWLDWELIRITIRDKGNIFVVAGWSHPVRWIVLSILMLRKLPFAIWADTPNLEKPRMWVKKMMWATWLKFLFRSAFSIMGTGTPCVKTLRKIGAPHEKTINFPCWVPIPKRVNYRPPTFVNNRIIYFSIGRLASIKGYDLAIKAFEIVANIHQEKKFEYWIFGDGPERNSLELLAKKTGISNIIKFWGWQEPEFIQDKIMEGDVLVHPALWEPYGVAVLEAMALGKPVIGSNKTMAAIDRITPSVNGLIHQAGNIEQLAKHLAFFIEYPDQIEVMGRASRLKAEEWPVGRGVEIIKIIARLDKVIIDEC